MVLLVVVLHHIPPPVHGVNLAGHRSPIGSALAGRLGQCTERHRVASVLPAGGSKHQLGTGVQAIQLSPYRAGLAEPALQRLQTVAALPTCCCLPWLSPQGRSVGPGTSSEFLLAEPSTLCRVTRRTLLLAQHPLEQGQSLGLGLAAPALGLHRFLGHELGPRKTPTPAPPQLQP